MRHVAVIDFGKTNVKVALVDTERLAEADVRRMPNTVRPGSPYPHYDTEAHWAFLLSALRDLGRSRRIDAISITTHGATAALVGRDGALILPILDYEHDGPDAVTARYDAIRPGFEVTGSPRLAKGLNLGAQLFWQFETFPEARNAAFILTYPQYWAFRLCGVPAAEFTSLGCHTDLWCPREKTFSPLVRATGWDRLMPPVRRASDVLGRVRADVAQAAGLSPGTPVLCGIHDSNASLLAHMRRRAGAFSVVSTGTWVVCMAVKGADVPLDPERDTLINVDALGEPVPSARFMGGREYEIVREGRDLDRGEADPERVLDAGVMLLPAVESGSGPFRGRAARWTVEPAGDGERAVALAWYLALMTDTCLSLIGAQGPVVVEGPFARNADFLAMLAAATGRPVEASAGNVTGTSIGAALLAIPASRLAGSDDGPPPTGPDRRLAAYADAWKRAAGSLP